MSLFNTRGNRKRMKTLEEAKNDFEKKITFESNKIGTTGQVKISSTTIPSPGGSVGGFTPSAYYAPINTTGQPFYNGMDWQDAIKIQNQMYKDIVSIHDKLDALLERIELVEDDIDGQN